jgi:hypothetical protein
VVDLTVTPNASQPRAETGIGFRAAFRGSFGRIPFKDDLRALPAILRTRAFFVPLIATVATIVLSVQPDTINSNLVQLAVQTVLLPPAFVVAFMGGMLTRRGSWMLGGIFGVLTYFGSLVVGSAADLSGLPEGNPVGATTLQTSATSVRLQVTSMGLPFQESLRAHLLDGTDDSCDRCPPASQSAHKSTID